MKKPATVACGAVLALLVALPTGGCRNIVGIEDGPPTDLFDTVCGVRFPGGDCARCITSSCCAEALRCEGDCASFAGCLAACAAGDAACAPACRGAYPKGYGAEAASLASCEAVKCASVCPIEKCGGYVYPNRDCGTCGAVQCCLEESACMGDVECAVLGACERACPVFDASCVQLCELAHPAGVSRERALGACLSDKCAASCIAPRWVCLEPPVPPSSSAATGPNIHITYRFIDYGTLGPVPGLTVRACTKTSTSDDCANPDTQGITGASGAVTLALGDNVFDGYAKITGPDYPEILVYLPRLTKDFDAYLGVVKEDAFTFLANPLAPPQPERGNLVVGVFDCAGGPAGGVKLAIDPFLGTTGFYFQNAQPTTLPMETEDDPVIGAYGGFLNVATDTLITVRATAGENGLTYAPAKVVARKAPGYTIVLLYAKPP